MFKRSIIISASFVVVSAFSGCSASVGVNTSDAGSAGESGGNSTAGTGGTSGKAGTSGNSLANQPGDAGVTAASCIKYGPITTDTTWAPLAECPNGFDVPDLVEVQSPGVTLTIKPGTVLKFASGSGINVLESAALVAVGTAASPIKFTGWQKAAGSWGGIVFYSGAIANEISYAIVEYGGEPSGASAGIVLGYDSQYSSAKLTNNQIHDNAKFGVTVYSNCKLTSFEDNTITANASGAIRVEAPSVHQLAGKGNNLTANGNGNTVRIETNSLMQVKDADVTWPNLAPAVYRVTGVGGTSGDQLYIKRHVTIEAGAVFEFVGGSGIDISDGTSGLSAIGTSAAPIVFRGVDGSGWTGIGFCESGWTGNALESVNIENAAGYPYSFHYCGSGATGVLRPGVLVGYNFAANASKLRIKNINVSGPNNAPTDLLVKGSTSLTQEGTNTGTGVSGALAVQTI